MFLSFKLSEGSEILGHEKHKRIRLKLLMLPWNPCQDHEFPWQACQDHVILVMTMSALVRLCMIMATLAMIFL